MAKPATPTETYSRDDWLAEVARVLQGREFDKALVSETLDGIRIEPLYGPGGSDRRGSVGWVKPNHLRLGEDPTAKDSSLRVASGSVGSRRNGSTQPTIGRETSDWRTPAWDIRQLHAAGDAAEVNEAILADLAGGTTSIALQLAVPGQSGLPPRYEAIARALRDVPLERTPIAVSAGDQYLGAAQSLMTLWDMADIPEERRQGAINADPLGTLALTGAIEEELFPSLDTLAHYVGQGIGVMPLVTTMLADGRPYHDAGASEAQELACLIGTAVEYLRALEHEGVRVDHALAKMAFALSADADQFLTIAKLRAARRLIWRIAEAAGHGDAGLSIHLTAETSQRMLTLRDPDVNMVRSTIATAAAALGGADAIIVLPYTWLIGQPDADARRLARNTQIVLMEESALGRVADPAAGSGYVEHLTDALARKAWEYFQEIERRGGMARALQSGMIGEGIARTAARREALLSEGKLEITGITSFPALDDRRPKAAPHPPRAAIAQAGTRIAELPLRRPAEPFEALRRRADAVAASTGSRPQIFLANLGTRKDSAAREDFARGLFAIAGLQAVPGQGGEDLPAIAAELKSSGAAVACLCSSDGLYGQHAVAAARALASAGARHILLAGRPGDRRPAYEEAGIRAFVHLGCDRLAALETVLDIIER